MNIAIFGAIPDEATALRENLGGHELRFFDGQLDTAFVAEDDRCNLPAIEALCVFVHDRVSGDVISGLPNLRLIVTRSTGFDHIDMDAANAAGITVCNVPSYGENTVAEFTYALILALSRNLHRAYIHSKQGDFSLDGLQGFDLKDRTIGIIGTGHIGTHVARIAKGFWMRTLATDIQPRPTQAQLLDIEYTSLDNLLERSDIVTLHTPLTAQTHHLIDATRIAQMKKGALLINTGRGGLVDTDAVVAALDSGHLRGAALDVLEEEEHLGEIGLTLLRHRPNLILTPHMAFDSREAVERILNTTVDNILAFGAGNPQNVVSGPAIDNGPVEYDEG